MASKLKKVKLSTTILGYSMAFNNPEDAFHGPKSGVTVFQIQANGAYKEVYAAALAAVPRRNSVRPVLRAGRTRNSRRSA